MAIRLATKNKMKMASMMKKTPRIKTKTRKRNKLGKEMNRERGETKTCLEEVEV